MSGPAFATQALTPVGFGTHCCPVGQPVPARAGAPQILPVVSDGTFFVAAEAQAAGGAGGVEPVNAVALGMSSGVLSAVQAAACALMVRGSVTPPVHVAWSEATTVAC